MRRYVLLFSLAGLIIPRLMITIWGVLEKYPGVYVSVGDRLEVFQRLLWPSSLFMIATAGHEDVDYGMLTFSTIVNMGIYTLVGAMTWHGLHKRRLTLFLLFVLVLVGWYKLLTL